MQTTPQTPTEERIAIVRDALLRLHTGAILPTREILCLSTESSDVCQACAKGALLMAWQERKPHVPLSTLTNIFGFEQLIQIEQAFEGRQANYHHKRYNASIAFGAKFATLPQKMEAIFQNMLANNGLFDPTKDGGK